RLNEEQLRRAEQASPSAVPGTRLIELRQTIAHARAAEEAARKQLPFLPEGAYDEVHLKTGPVESPIAGRLIETHLAPRQLVAVGDPLWTVADWSRLWVRVPVFVADVARIVHDAAASVTTAGAKDALSGKPVPTPQMNAAGKQTVELIYE